MQLDFAHVWAATVSGADALDELFDEQYGADGEPISLFAECQGEWFYDHDMVYAELLEDLALETMLETCHIPEENRTAIIKAWQSQANSGANALIVGDVGEFPSPRGWTNGTVTITYNGKFKHWITTGQVYESDGLMAAGDACRSVVINGQE